MSVSSYETFKQEKEIPKRLKKLEKEVKEISRKIKEKATEPLPYEPVELSHPSREMAGIPVVQEWDMMACVTASVVWYPNGESANKLNKYWNGFMWVFK